MATKMGRPTENPKDYMLRVRIDSETLLKLDKCCKESGLSKSDIVRNGISEQYDKLKCDE